MDRDGQWTKAGELNQARDSNNVIYDGEYLMVIGGYNQHFSTEKCSLTDGSISCTSQNPVLYDYYVYPELFLISDDFCHH